MGQVWSKADFNGTNEAGHSGGRGSVLAVTAQNAGPDGRYGTSDDVLAPLNDLPASMSIDASPGPDCQDPLDRVRGFYSFHVAGANFLYGDGSVHFLSEEMATLPYISLSTVDDDLRLAVSVNR